jgi:hypothetical protein
MEIPCHLEGTSAEFGVVTFKGKHYYGNTQKWDVLDLSRKTSFIQVVPIEDT